MALPVLVRMRARKPCLRLRLSVEGWYSRPRVLKRTEPREGYENGDGDAEVGGRSRDAKGGDGRSSRGAWNAGEAAVDDDAKGREEEAIGGRAGAAASVGFTLSKRSERAAVGMRGMLSRFEDGVLVGVGAANRTRTS